MRLLVGTDLVAVSRLSDVLAQLGGRFLDRAFTPAEQAECGGDPTRLAGRWAVKESVCKALQRGVDELPLTDIEVTSGPNGAPTLRLSGRAQAAARAAGVADDADWSLSIAHDGGFATAVVGVLC